MYSLYVGVAIVIILVFVIWLLSARLFSKIGNVVTNVFAKPFKDESVEANNESVKTEEANTK